MASSAKTASAAATKGNSSNNNTLPTVVRDPRFRAGRKLVQTGQSEKAIDLFANLLQETRRLHGDSDSGHTIEAAPAYYEYGNALFRHVQSNANSIDEEDEEADEVEEEETTTKKLTPREAAALAAERRFQGKDAEDAADQKPAAVVTKEAEEDSKEIKTETVDKGGGEETTTTSGDQEDGDDDDDDFDDFQLAREMMETAWSILDTTSQSPSPPYSAWIMEQIPRVLTGIGDVLSAQHRHADAAHTYSQALGHRQDAVAKFDASTDTSVAFLQARRRVVEINVLISEELLAAPANANVVTTETKQLIVAAAERVDYARGYYEKARDELQEVVLLMGQMVAQGVDVGQEKEDVCFVATLVMGVGNGLALEDEEAAAAKEPSPKKQKRL